MTRVPPAAGLLVAACVATLTVGCTGEIGSPSGRSPARPASPATPTTTARPAPRPGSPPDLAQAGPGPLGLRRLSNEELVNTLGDLLGLAEPQRAALAADLPPESIGDSGFLAPGLVGADDARRIGEKARQAAAFLPAAGLGGCAAGTGEEACVRRFLQGFAARAFRRAPEADELDDLAALHRELRRIGRAPDEATREVVAAILQGPQFLYHGQPGGAARAVRDGSGVRLTPHELASRLSYFLWRTMPDEALFEAAGSGRLASGDELERQARRLLADGRAQRTIEAFFLELLRVDEIDAVARDAKLGAFPPAVRERLAQEVRAFVADLLAGDGRLETLLTAPHTLVDETLAKHYGIAGVKGATWKKVVPEGERAGLLTLGGVMAVHATAEEGSPIKRGAFLRQKILCQPLPPQPPVVPQLPGPAAGRTIRERLAAHAAEPTCRVCHELLDPAGFAFSAFDALGRHRPLDPAGQPLDTSGHVTNLDGETRRFGSLGALARLLAASDEVRRCAVRQWARFALGREPTEGEAPALAEVYDAFSRAGFDLRALLVAIATSPAFRTRAAAPDEI